MDNYNQVPSQGTISNMVNAINANFQLTQEMLERLQTTKDKARGLFLSSSALTTAYPSPTAGDYAFVGTESPFAIYICTTDGTWSDSGEEYTLGDVDLTDYVTHNEFDPVLDASMVDTQITQSLTGAGYTAKTFEIECEGGDILILTPSPYNWDTTGHASAYVFQGVAYAGDTSVGTLVDTDGDEVKYEGSGGIDESLRKLSYTIAIPQNQNITSAHFGIRAKSGDTVTFTITRRRPITTKMDALEEEIDVLKEAVLYSEDLTFIGTGKGYVSGSWAADFYIDCNDGDVITISPQPYNWDVTSGSASADNPSATQNVFYTWYYDANGTDTGLVPTDTTGLALRWLRTAHYTTCKESYTLVVPSNQGIAKFRFSFRATKNVEVTFAVVHKYGVADALKEYIEGGSDVTTTDIVKQNRDKADLITALKTNNWYTSLTAASGEGYNDNLCLCISSDIHGDVEACKRFIKLGMDYGLEMLHLGDSVEDHCSQGSPWTGLNNMDSVMNIVGNHDTKGDNDNTTHRAAGRSDVYNLIIAPFVSTKGVTQPIGAATNYLHYWYKDYTTAGIRLIALDCMEWGRNNTFAAAQLSWFGDLLDGALSNNLAVIIACHYRADTNTKHINAGWPGAWRDFTTVGDAWIGGEPSNMEALVNRNTTGGADIIGLVSDFIDSGGEFVCWLGGHAHREWMSYLQADPRQITLLLNSSCNLKQAQFLGYGEDTSSKFYDYITLLSIERNYKTFTMMRIGRDIDRHGRKADPITVNYMTKELVSEFGKEKADGLVIDAFESGIIVIDSSVCCHPNGKIICNSNKLYYKVGSTYYDNWPTYSDYCNSGTPSNTPRTGVTYWYNNQQYMYINSAMRPLTFFVGTEAQYTALNDTNNIAFIIES